MDAWILSIGNELLIGRIVNTNASWLAKRLVFLGFDVKRIITVPDSIDDIVEELGRGLEKAKLIVTTGGLGPTYDDMTSEAVAQALNRQLEKNEKALIMVREFYSKKRLPLTPEREKMAYIPAGARVLPNPVGAAPGFIAEEGDKSVVVLPGVPVEMKSIFEQYVEPYIRRKYNPDRKIAEYFIVVKGVPESELAPFINDLSRRNPDVYLKSHPKGHETRSPLLDIRILVSGLDDKSINEKASHMLSAIEEKAKSLGGAIVEKGRSI